MTLMVLILLLGVVTQAALAADTVQGTKLFQVHCAGCHPQGGNIIRRGKNLKQRALRRNGMDSVEAIISLVENGKNNMSAYKDRLSASEIEAVSAYVLAQAATGWRS
ncbi:MAG: c-type cytochrome [Symploca sp. SIO1C4]|uniref:C-type cytochrome n=1 Tax=Symploca sp. SIO1C4 TaxID=2607765 RepID=A0A6B3NFE2_9CYAN|nr:c-type cytochrome [Symploca sp. SIO1C4]